MMEHIALGTNAAERKSRVRSLIAAGEIQWGGNKKLKIYGTLACSSGKRMMVQNRVFFISEAEALSTGYRPCGRCMPESYRQWKTEPARR